VGGDSIENGEQAFSFNPNTRSEVGQRRWEGRGGFEEGKKRERASGGNRTQVGDTDKNLRTGGKSGGENFTQMKDAQECEVK